MYTCPTCGDIPGKDVRTAQEWRGLRGVSAGREETMSLRFAILGLLARESLTGYDLTKRFDTTIAFFWSAKHSQIYPELATLTKEGLVTYEVVTQTSKPNKKVYTITPEGIAALAAWVSEPRDKRTVKDPM